MCKYRVEYSGRKAILDSNEPMQMQMWYQNKPGLTRNQIKMVQVNLDLVRMSGYLHAYAEIYRDDVLSLIITADTGAYRFYRISGMDGRYIRRVCSDPANVVVLPMKEVM